MENLRSGVPQGSILGPLLFLLYVNDLHDSLKATAKIFADDTKLYLTNLQFSKKNWLLNFIATKCVILKIRQNFNFNDGLQPLVIFYMRHIYYY